MPDTQTPLERAARALCVAQGCRPTENEMARAKEEVRAVLMALREPTPFMVQAAYEKAGGCSAENLPPAETWQAMIDAMLAENAR